MTNEELKQLNEFRQDGETISDAKVRWDAKKAKEEKIATYVAEKKETNTKMEKVIEGIEKHSERVEKFTADDEEKKSEVALLESNPNVIEVVDERSYSDDSDFQESDLIIPVWKIVQNSCRIEGCKPYLGQFYNTVSEEYSEKLENVTFLKRMTGRVLFPKENYSGDRLCWSDDNVTPSEIVEFPKCENCKNCELSVWSKDENGKNKPPKCKETISFMSLEDNFSPFIIRFSGTAMPPVKALLSNLFLKTKLGIIQKKKLSLRSFSVSISLVEKINDAGKFYIPVFSNIKEVETEKIELISALYETVSEIQRKKQLRIVEQTDEVEKENFKGNEVPF